MQHYGYMSTLGLSPTCKRETIGQLVDMRRRAPEYASRNGHIAPDEYFFAEQNARLVRNAEEYYRTMFGDSTGSWNLRDRHMADTLTELMEFLGHTSPARTPRVVVWAHNSHIGDARATSMGEGGELNIGQLARERFGASAFLIGQTTFNGTVTAASSWDGPAARKRVRDGLPGSIERLLHDAGLERAILPLTTDLDLNSMLRPAHLERAIGVLYLPDTERRSHYFHARVSDQFDAVIHVDSTHALEPLERTAGWDSFEVSETYPSGL
jgi:erythromycin esterase-like protein